jgi:hypothetical protein
VTKKIQKLVTLRPEAAALALVMVATAGWVVSAPGPLDRFGTLKGTDFSQFYVAARLVATRQGPSLYGPTFVQGLQEWVPGPPGLLYLPVYPPTMAWLLAPLGHLGYFSALCVWTCVSALGYFACCSAVLAGHQGLKSDRTTSWLLALAFPAFWQLLLFGQISVLPLALVTVAWGAWRQERPFLAGLALGALLLKPQMLTVAAAAVILLRSWRLLWGVIAGTLLELLLTTVVAGVDVMRAYGHVAKTILSMPDAFEPRPQQIQSLRGFVWLVAGDGTLATVLTILLAVVVLLVAARAVRHSRASQMKFEIAVLAGTILNPHAYVYDLVLLVVPLGAICAWWFTRTTVYTYDRAVATLARTVFWLPLVAPILGMLRLQLTAPAMLALLWALGLGAPARPIGDR